MRLSDEQTEKIKEYAGLFLTPREIACLMDLPIGEFTEVLQDPLHPAATAYLKGKAQSKYEIRKKVIDLAKKGSPQAENLADKYIEEQRLYDDE